MHIEIRGGCLLVGVNVLHIRNNSLNANCSTPGLIWVSKFAGSIQVLIAGIIEPLIFEQSSLVGCYYGLLGLGIYDVNDYLKANPASFHSTASAREIRSSNWKSRMRFRAPIAAALAFGQGACAAFGLTSTSSRFQVDTDAGLVFEVNR